MSTAKDKPKKHSTAAVPNGDVVEYAAKRKSKRMSRKAARIAAPRELVFAVKEGKIEVIERMLREDPALKKSLTDPETNQTLLHTAIRTGSEAVVECLISAGVSTLDVDLKFRNALHFLARVKDAPQGLIDKVVQLKGLPISGEDVSGATPLHLAIRYNNTRLTDTLIAHPSISINAEDVAGLTPLHYACHEGREHIVSELLEAGANPSAVDHKGNTPLHYACDTGSIPIGKLLLAKGVDIMAENARGDTPLHRAVEKKQESMCTWLVNNGADVRVRYEKRLYEARHKILRRKYLRQAAREARASTAGRGGVRGGGGVGGGGRDSAEEEAHASDSDGEDLPDDDPDGMMTLHDQLDTYGFLLGSLKSNQLQEAESHSLSSHNAPNGTAPKSRKPTKPGAKIDFTQNDEEDLIGGPSADALHEREKAQQKLIKKWVKITRIWTDKDANAVYKQYPKSKIRSLIYKGIPNHVRAGVWRCISGTLEMKLAHPGEYERLASMDINRKDSNQLDIDINRTNRSHFLFKERYGQGQISLFSILRAYINYDPVVGYCQGMSDLTALMMQYIEEEEAFWLLVRFMKDPAFNMAGRFQNDFKDLKRAWYVHEKLLEHYLPRLYAFISGAHIEAAHYTIKWYLKCFLDALSFDCVLRIWDVLLLEGSDILYSFVITLLKYHESHILAMDPGELLMYLPGLKGPPANVTVNEWLKDVKKNPIKTKLIRAYEAEFDAAWPAMAKAAKEEADRKEAEWNKRREKAKAAEAAAIAAAVAPVDDPVESEVADTADSDRKDNNKNNNDDDNNNDSKNEDVKHGDNSNTGGADVPSHVDKARSSKSRDSERKKRSSEGRPNGTTSKTKLVEDEDPKGSLSPEESAAPRKSKRKSSSRRKKADLEIEA